MPPRRQLGGRFHLADLDPIHDLMGLGKIGLARQQGSGFMGLPIAAPLGLDMLGSLFGNGGKQLEALQGGMMLGAALARAGDSKKKRSCRGHSGNTSALQDYQKRLKKLKAQYPNKSHKALVQMAKR
jgi:hypothetical protein